MTLRIVFLLVTIFVTVTVASGQTRSNPFGWEPRVDSDAGLEAQRRHVKISIAVVDGEGYARTRFVTGDTVRVRIFLTSDGPAPVWTSTTESYLQEWPKLMKDGREVSYSQTTGTMLKEQETRPTVTGLSVFSLKPGVRRETSLIDLESWSRELPYATLAPGIYRLTLEHRFGGFGQGPRVESNAVSFEVQAPEDAAEYERVIKKILLLQNCDDRIKGPDKTAMIKDLGTIGELGTILIGMMTRYRFAKPETMEYLYLEGSLFILGQMKEARAVPQLLQLAIDRKAHENVRAQATKSVGQIDAEGNKNFLLRILNASREYYLMRIYAAEGLARTDDPKALIALNRHTLAERDTHVREQFKKAAHEIKARISGKR